MKNFSYSIIGLIFLFTLNGCANFLAGNKLKVEIESAIDYAAQKPFEIRFEGVGGTISPDGVHTCRVTDSFTLIFKENNNRCFSGWQVLADNKVLTDEEASEIIYFEHPEKNETKIIIKKKAEKLTVRGVTAARPVIVSASPSMDPEGVYRDRRITVMFNKKMDESSIYYTESEIKELEEKGYALLTDENHNNKCYGYDDNGNIVFKNITITHRTNENLNFLKHYTAPYFDENDSSVLYIYTKQEKDAPPSATEILVTIGKDMFYKDSDKNSISMTEDYPWSYFTNSRVDVEAPVFIDNADSGFTVTLADDDQEKFLTSKLSLNDDSTKFDLKESTNKENYINYNLKNKKLWVRGGFVDTGSGPASLTWKLYKVKSDEYNVTFDSPVENAIGKIGLSITGSTAAINPELDTSNKDFGGQLLDLSPYLQDNTEGLYRIDFTALDKNGKGSTQNYYFLYDDKAPEKPQNVLWGIRISNNKIVFNYESGSEKDKDYIRIYDTDANSPLDKKDAFTNTKFESEITFSGRYQNKQFYLQSVDLSGNVSEAYPFQFSCKYANRLFYNSTTKDLLLSDLTSYSGYTQIGVVYKADTMDKIYVVSEEQVVADDNNYWDSKYQLYRYNDVMTPETSGLDNHNISISDETNAKYIHNYLNTNNINMYNNKLTWFVPSQAELSELLINYSSLNSKLNTPISTDYIYWSSSVRVVKQSVGNFYIMFCAISVDNQKFNILEPSTTGLTTTHGIYHKPGYFRPIAILDLTR